MGIVIDIVPLLAIRGTIMDAGGRRRDRGEVYAVPEVGVEEAEEAESSFEQLGAVALRALERLSSARLREELIDAIPF
jgi:hypothetical protein